MTINPTLAITVRYTLYFTFVYAIAIILGNLATYFIHVEFLNAITVAGFMSATVFSASQFAYEQNRLPKQNERLFITIGCIVFAYGASLIAYIALAYIDRISAIDRIMNMSWGLMAVTYLITTMIYMFAVYFSFDWVVDMILKYQKKNNKQPKVAKEKKEAPPKKAKDEIKEIEL